jgi:hypothetical protein
MVEFLVVRHGQPMGDLEFPTRADAYIYTGDTGITSGGSPRPSAQSSSPTGRSTSIPTACGEARPLRLVSYG